MRHDLVAGLAIGVCAVLAGARTFTAIGERAYDLPVARGFGLACVVKWTVPSG
jgi:hypothetical protein